MKDLWLPRQDPNALVVDDDGYVMRKVDRTLPPGTAYHIKPKDLLLAMARMSRDGKTREQIRRELDIPHVGPLAVDNATFDRALARARAMLEAEIAAGREPAETVSEERVPYDDE